MISVTQDRRVQYRVSYSGFLDNLRMSNGIEGRGVTTRHGFHFLGIKRFDEFTYASVYFSLLESELNELDRIRLLSRDIKSIQIVVFAKWPDVGTYNQIVSKNLYVTDLSDCLQINWPPDITSIFTDKFDCETTEPEYSLRREESYWRLSFEGEEAIVPESKGINYIARLLANPNRNFTALELANPGFESHASTDIEATDLKSLRQYRQRLQKIDAALEEARNFDRFSEIRVLEEEKDAIIQHLSQVASVGGRSRRSGQRERARQSVSKAIARCLKSMPLAAEHISTRLRRGSSFSYSPDPNEHWTVESQKI